MTACCLNSIHRPFEISHVPRIHLLSSVKYGNLAILSVYEWNALKRMHRKTAGQCDGNEASRSEQK